MSVKDRVDISKKEYLDLLESKKESERLFHKFVTIFKVVKDEYYLNQIMKCDLEPTLIMQESLTEHNKMFVMLQYELDKKKYDR